MDRHMDNRTNEGENGTYKVGEVADDARNQRERSVSLSLIHTVVEIIESVRVESGLSHL